MTEGDRVQRRGQGDAEGQRTRSEPGVLSLSKESEYHLSAGGRTRGRGRRDGRDDHGSGFYNDEGEGNFVVVISVGVSTGRENGPINKHDK